MRERNETQGENPSLRRSFAALLKSYRGAARLTQEELAERAGVSVRTVSSLEGGTRHVPYKETVRLLAEALALSPEEHATFVAAARPQPVAGVAGVLAQAAQRPSAQPLPIPATPLIGREREVHAACAMMRRPEVRLLTLLGPPGVGKTRLSLTVAAELAADFAGGVCFVALASLRDPAHVVPALARAVGVQETGIAESGTALIAALRERQTLLLLDNFEHVAAAAPVIAEMLAACAGVKVLVTSRATLHVRGEQSFPVPPLALPDASSAVEPVALQVLAQTPAVQLFLDRAQRVKPAFALTAQNARTIAAICRRLDGLPLALELAAARVKLLSPDDLLSRLEHRFALLTSGARDLPDRQQTLRGALAWSYDLLDAREQAVFRQLAVFAGDASRAAAVAVCGGCLREGHGEGHGATEEVAILDVLTMLLDKSLLVCEPVAEGGADATRIRMLETMREYAWEHLVANDEAEAARRVHARYYVDQTEAIERLPERERWARYWASENELDNFRAALRWAMKSQATADIEIGLRLAGALGMFWYSNGHLSEGLTWLQGLLARADDVAPVCAVPVRGKALYMAGWIATDQGEYARAATLLAQSAALYRATDDHEALANALNRWGDVTLQQGEYARAEALFSESLALRRRVGDPIAIAGSLNNLAAVAAEQKEYARAVALLDEGLALYKSLGAYWGEMFILNNLGDVLREQGDSERATALWQESLAIARGSGDTRAVAFLLGSLGRVAHEQNDCAGATRLLRESLELERELENPYAIAYCLLSLANIERDQAQYGQALDLYWESLTLYNRLAVTRGAVECMEGLASVVGVSGKQAEQAAWLCGAVAALREAIGTPLLLREGSSYERAMLAARGFLGEEHFAAAWAAGRGVQAEAVIPQVMQMAGAAGNGRGVFTRR